MDIFENEIQFFMPRLKERETITSGQINDESNDEVDNVDDTGYFIKLYVTRLDQNWYRR